MAKPKIVILGAGYGGIMTSKNLEKLLKADEAEVMLINKHDYHYVTTQLHKTCAGTASDEKIAMPIRDLIDQKKINFKKATVSSLDFNHKTILLEGGEEVSYDYLLVALGFKVETFGTPGIEEHAFNLRSFRTSKEVFPHILKQFSLYKEDQDESRLTFAVAGAGFTGTEMIGELIEKLPEIAKSYGVPFNKIKIINIEAAPTVLPGFEKEAVDYTNKYLIENGVQVMTSTKILECTENYVKVAPGIEIPTKTLIWSCGVRGHELFDKAGLKTVRGKMQVDKFLRIPDVEGVFCIGDNAWFMKDEKSALPPTAQVALQQAPVCAKNIVATIRGEQLEAFEYHHKGSVASIGERAAVGKVGPVVIKGKFAAFMKEVIEMRYLFYLNGPSFMVKQFLKRKPQPTHIQIKQVQ
ncbi:NAD(P)/FAD-dependent oxidoreductase [Bacillus sp. T3]|uniref:NAD(P)/FAD-dependent oxidoreductase n=1 Tax=Bacillus sp. T3 TaxID=467262 RepID=UPI002982755A|nr:NAD(P)/FAD-dependent oxidoreductase [Bacillus sp. T3]